MGSLRSLDDVSFSGVGGEEMAREGLDSLFPFGDLAVMGLLPVLARLPRLIARIDETARAIIANPPDCLVLIDAPDFTHRVARRVRAALPDIPIVDYVCPTVWAWRPGRARRMHAYIDHVLAVLPFEPEVLARLEGPPCDYVGHPLIEKLELLTATEAEKSPNGPLLILPGSRRAEIQRMMPVYGETVAILAREFPTLEMALPVVPHVEATVSKELSKWDVKPRLLTQREKYAAFRSARAALVTSGVATLELALANVPMAVAYKVAPLESLLGFLVKVDSIVLPNLIVGFRAAPEFLQKAATPLALAETVAGLMRDGPARSSQLSAFKELRRKIDLKGAAPSLRAAEIILRYAERPDRK